MRFLTPLLLIQVCFIQTLFSQSLTNVGVRSQSLSDAVIAGPDEWSAIQNQAGLGLRQDILVGIMYSNRYMISELSTRGVMITLPTALGTFAPSLSYFGNKYYNESQISVAYGKQIFEWASAGICMNYYRQSLESSQENTVAISGELGLMLFPLKDLVIGIHTYNPTLSGYNNEAGDPLESSLKAGISYSHDKEFYTSIQVECYNYQHLNFAFGAEYFPVHLLAIRAGIKLPYCSGYSFGLGFEMNRFTIDTSFGLHTVLGLSSAVSILIKLGKI